MPTTTALGLPVPSDTDPVSDGALAIRNLANAIDVKKVRKSADQDVTNSTALVDDAALSFAVAAGKNYLFELLLLTNATVNTADLKLSFSIPAGGRIDYGVIGPDVATTTATEKQINIAVTQTASDTPFVGVGSSAGQVVRIAGSYEGGGTAGTVKLRWAQATAAVGTTTRVLEGSTLRAEVI